jgi:hypothetical protein
MRSWRNGSFEAMKALVIKKNFKNHCAPPDLWKKTDGTRKFNKLPCPRCASCARLADSPEHASCRHSREEFKELVLTSRNQTLGMRTATLPVNFPAIEIRSKCLTCLGNVPQLTKFELIERHLYPRQDHETAGGKWSTLVCSLRLGRGSRFFRLIRSQHGGAMGDGL